MSDELWFTWNNSTPHSPFSTLDNTSHMVSMSVLEGGIVGGLLGLIILSMIIGNLFVILAILLDRDLQRPQYYLILSLAFADLIVGVVVSPLAAINEVHREWRLGVQLCDFWISMDVLACTSSILHLVAIALDRYWSITDVVYVQNRTPTKIVLMLAVVWFLSLVISVAPIFGWKDDQFHHRVNFQKECLISQDVGYQMFSTTAAFYGPLILIIVVYWQIYKAARRRIRKTRDRKLSHAALTNMNSLVLASVNNTNISTLTSKATLSTPSITRTQALLAKFKKKPSSTGCDREDESFVDSLDTPEPEDEIAVLNNDKTNGTTKADGPPTNAVVSFNEESHLCAQLDPNGKDSDNIVKTTSMVKIKKKKNKESAESRRERKAWRTLAIITGTFVICWLPFFMLAVVRPLCQCRPDPILESVFLWLGYFNCAINPLIYTIFSPDFRNAFKKILVKICFPKNRAQF